MSNYRKLVAGIVGVSLILLKHFTGIELPGLGDQILEVAMAIGTWVSVWWFPNEPPTSAERRNTAVGASAGGVERDGEGRPQ